MGRELKRVALDFDWPLKKVWQGFINPHTEKHIECSGCDGTGYSPYFLYLKEVWYGTGIVHFDPAWTGSSPIQPSDQLIRENAARNCVDMWKVGYRFSVEAEIYRLTEFFNNAWMHHLTQDDVDALVEDSRLVEFTHEWVKGQGWVRRADNNWPTAEEVNRWGLFGLGHDSTNCHIVICERLEKQGYPYECPKCNGDGFFYPSLELKQLDESWQSQEPPIGEGWQVWETVTEGSPISPVFETADKLIEWLQQSGYSQQAAEKFVNGSGWAPSLTLVDGVVYKDIESLSDRA